jgi:hypothetical protein
MHPSGPNTVPRSLNITCKTTLFGSWYYGSYKSLSVILRQLQKVECDITTALKNQVWYLKSHRIAKIQSLESLNRKYDISHAIHAECDNTQLQKNRCDIIPAETHWMWYFKCSFSLNEILYKLEMQNVIF